MAGKRGRPPGSTNKKGNKVVDNLNLALDFLAPAVKDIVYIGPDHVEAFNGVLSIGAPIQSGIERLCPNYNLLRAAIKRAGETPSLTKIDEGRLGVTGGKFRAVVPCIQEDLVTLADQNEKKYPIDDIIKQGFELLNPIIKEAGKTMIEASLLLQSDTMVATDRHVMVEFKHNLNFPKVVLPKAFLNAVIACKKKLVMFGFGEVSGAITFWFEDNSWIQTQLYQEDWPNYLNVFDANYQATRPVPEGMFDAIEALSEFAQDGDVFFGEHAIRSHDDISQGASYEFNNSPVVNVAFNAKRMLVFRDKFSHVVFDNKKAIFLNDQPMMRGAIVQRTRMNEPAIQDDRPNPVQFAAPEGPDVPEPQPQGSFDDMAAIPIPPPAPEPSPRPPTPDTPAAEIQMAETFPDWVWGDDDFEEIDWNERKVEGEFREDPQQFNIDAHNRHAAENMAKADPHAAMYPGVGESAEITPSGYVVRDVQPQAS